MNNTNNAFSTEKHNPPRYYGYSGGWANVLICDCGSVSLYEDNHPAHPCVDCGTKKQRKVVSAKYVRVSQAVWYNPLTWFISHGYWEFADE
jgi:hypothetical protein